MIDYAIAFSICLPCLLISVIINIMQNKHKKQLLEFISELLHELEVKGNN
jgi:hypothetical protein